MGKVGPLKKSYTIRTIQSSGILFVINYEYGDLKWSQNTSVWPKS